MLQSKKSHVKVTKKGVIQRVVQEHYLRDDIPCGIIGCSTCVNNEAALLDSGNLIILPDTNILLHHWDLCQQAPLANLVILKTVLDEVKNRHHQLVNKIRGLAGVYVFANEFHRACVDPEAEPSSESDNDRNDRAIRLACKWYTEHAKQVSPSARVLLLTNDARNRELALQMGLSSQGLRQFCEAHPKRDLLLDMIARDDLPEAEGKEDLFPEHLSPSAVNEGLTSGALLRGVLQASATSKSMVVRTEVPGELATIPICDWRSQNRALPGDTVAIRVVRRTEAALSSPVEQTEQLQSVILEDEADLLDVTHSTVEAVVVAILKRPVRHLAGSLDRRTVNGQSVLFQPLDRRMPRIRMRTQQPSLLVGQRLVVSVDGWERKSRLPHGHLVRVLGRAGDRATETEALLLAHDVAHDDWTPAIMACLPTADYQMVPEEGREDLRHLSALCSIDPPGCTDIDDTLHARRLPGGLIEVGVHIADVTHFVRPKTPLDLEASRRATTVYLVDRRIDMLPSILGTNLCSLKSQQDRYAFSVIWTMRESDAQVESVRFCKSLIRSRASLTYDLAQTLLEGKSLAADARDLSGHEVPAQDPGFIESLHLLNGLAKQLKAKRMASGALTLASPEIRFSLDRETQNPVDVQLKEMKEANSLVEEFMLLANVAVAEQTHRHHPELALLRRHPAPPADNFAALNEALMRLGATGQLDVSSSAALANSLDALQIPGDEYFNRLMRIMATRCMLQAVYFCSSSLPYEQYWHYGLAMPIYTHFTSPIRRYADVMVHRLLEASLTEGKVEMDRIQMEEICDNLNYRNRMSQYAQRASIELFTHLFFRERPLKNEPAYIIKTMASGIVVLLPDYGVEGMVAIDHSCLHFDGLKHAWMQGEQFFFRLFQRITISVEVQEDTDATNRQRLIIKVAELEALGDDRVKRSRQV